MISTWWHCEIWRSFYVFEEWTWITYINNVLSIKTILFDILDFWCQLVVIRFVKTRSKRRMFVSFMKISACWFLHCLIKFNKFFWEKRPAKLRPNLQTSFSRRDLKNTQPHLNSKISLQKIPFAYNIFFAVSNRGPSIRHGFFCGAPSAVARGWH